MTINIVYLIIPVYNEEKYLPSFIPNLIEKVNKIPKIKRIVFVNDGSKDSSESIIKSFKVKNFEVVSHSQNKGKGEALRTGLNYAKAEVDAVIFMDGDNQHDPKFLPNFIEKLEKYPIVFGYRKLAKDSPSIRRRGNQLAGFIIEKVFKIRRQDLLCGFMAFRKDVFNKLHWGSKGYGVEAELTAFVGRSKIPFTELLISTIYFDTSKGVTWKHAARILLTFPKWYFSVKPPKIVS